MVTMKDVPLPRTVVITGASAGLGSALALLYAAPGRKLILIARDETRLAAVAAKCRARDAIVETLSLDVTDSIAVGAALNAVDERQHIDLIIANAGVFTGHGQFELETAADIAWMSRVNFEGVVNVVQPLLQSMRGRKSGHIAIVGSLAALQPLADAPGYSASKAAAMAYGEALREYLVPDGVLVSLIYPGHIETAQVADHVGPLPGLMSAESAARIIKRSLDRKKTFIAFPAKILALIRLGRSVPWRVRAIGGKDLRFHVNRPPAP